MKEDMSSILVGNIIGINTHYSTNIKNNKRRQIETQMDSFDDKELMLIESLAKGIIHSKKIQ